MEEELIFIQQHVVLEALETFLQFLLLKEIMEAHQVVPYKILLAQEAAELEELELIVQM